MAEPTHRTARLVIPPGGFADTAPSPAPPQYIYSFSVRPAEASEWLPETVELFGLLEGRVECLFDDGAFGMFRDAVKRDGFTLHDVRRVPYQEAESVP